MTYRVPLASSSIGVDEAAAAQRVFASGRLTQGLEVAAFERELAAWHGVTHAIMVNSGSSANLVAIEAAVMLSRLRPDRLPTGTPIQPGDEAIIQGLNWPSTIKPLLNLGIRPVFCDVEPGSLNAGVDQVAAARSPRTRMVVAVPVLGNPTHLDELRAWCAAEGLLLIEDACESLGAVTAAGRKVGTLGLASAFSFYFSHHITTIEGGAILTDSDALADMCYSLRAHGWSRDLRLEAFLDFDIGAVDPRFCFVLPGYNVRSTDLNAALGRVQLAHLDRWIDARRRIAADRARALADHAGAVIPGAHVDGHSWMTTPLLFSTEAHRRRGQALLEAAGIETRPIIVGNFLRQPVARALGLSERQPALPICDEVFARGLMIGLNPASSDEDEDFVCATLRRAANA